MASLESFRPTDEMDLVALAQFDPVDTIPTGSILFFASYYADVALAFIFHFSFLRAQKDKGKAESAPGLPPNPLVTGGCLAFDVFRANQNARRVATEYSGRVVPNTKFLRDDYRC